MVDYVEIVARAGAGGDGCVSFRREKFVPMGGPDGGDGGRGGSVTLIASESVNTLLHLRYSPLLKAKRGGHGQGKGKHGANGDDLQVQVPVGTVITVAQGDAAGSRVELTAPGQAVVVARGGRGGRGNRHYVSSTNQAPYLAEAGAPGEELQLIIELKLLADVGIIGLPNAGKSTLLSTVSAARPKVAPYPFTTTQPVLGVVRLSWRDMVIVEIPGLIEGAHTGKGLGDTFLRHAERTTVFIHLLDGTSEHLVDDVTVVNRELKLFSPELAERPQVLAVNKMDIPAARVNFEVERVALKASGYSVFAISAATREGVPELLEAVAAKLPQPEPAASGVVEMVTLERARPERGPIVVTREGDVFVVSAPRVERLAKRSDLRKWEGLAQFRHELYRTGVAATLEQAGVRPGDTVRVGTAELEWV